MYGKMGSRILPTPFLSIGNEAHEPILPTIERRRLSMRIDKQAIDYLKKEKGSFYQIQGKYTTNFSGCGCSSEGVTSVEPEVFVGAGEIPAGISYEEVEGVRIVVLPEVKGCITDETLLTVDRILFMKKPALKNTVPLVVKRGANV